MGNLEVLGDVRVFVYRNLRFSGVIYSVKDVRKGLVMARVPEIYLKDCKLKVSQAGRARVLAEKRKNVHAGIQGHVMLEAPQVREWVQVRYNPYETRQFQTIAGKEIFEASFVKITPVGCFVSKEEAAWR